MTEAKAGYVKLAQQLRRRFVRHQYGDEALSRWDAGDDAGINDGWPEVAEWMIREVMPGIKRVSWRSYTAAVRAVADDPEVQSIFARVRGKPCEQEAAANGRSRAHGVSAQDLKEIESWIADGCFLWGGSAVVWLRSTLLTGLRPGEWSNASIVSLGEGRIGLFVATLKTANRVTSLDQDPGGDTRTIPLDHLDDEDMDALNAHLRLWRKYVTDKASYHVYLKGCANVLSRANRELWHERLTTVSLYSGRHQFRTACLASGLTDVEIAVLMGHDSTKTGRHYGGRAYPSRTTNATRPLPSEVAAWREARAAEQ